MAPGHESPHARRRQLALPSDTERLVLRDFAAGDQAAVTALYCDARITRHMLYGPRDQDSARRHLASVIRRQSGATRDLWELAVTLADDGRLVGACDLTLHSREEAEIGYLLSPRHWGQGFGTEIALALVGSAFNQLGVDRVLSTVEIHNQRSMRVLDKAGLRWEASLRRHARVQSRWWDVHLYSVSREDWLLAQA
jgi:RimJ/RimL family protein N-acetyltransferase